MKDDTTEEERERYRELLEELRTIIPGAQVLFAFLLTAPFATRFSELDTVARVIFTLSLVAIAMATVLFLAPAAYHRLADRHDRRARLHFGVKTTLAGMSLLCFSISSAVLVVVRFLFGSMIGAVVAAATVLVAIVMWYVIPLYNRYRWEENSEAGTPKNS
jgi:MFS family permease